MPVFVRHNAIWYMNFFFFFNYFIFYIIHLFFLPAINEELAQISLQETLPREALEVRDLLTVYHQVNHNGDEVEALVIHQITSTGLIY